MASSTVKENFLHHSFFFTALERDQLANTKASTPSSLLIRVLSPVWKFVDYWIPDSVAPAAISLLSAVFALQAYQIMNTPQFSATMAVPLTVALLLLSVSCTCIEHVHANRLHSITTVGCIFAKMGSTARTVFCALAFFPIIGIESHKTQWFLSMAVQYGRLFNGFLVNWLQYVPNPPRPPTPPSPRPKLSKILRSPKKFLDPNSYPNLKGTVDAYVLHPAKYHAATIVLGTLRRSTHMLHSTEAAMVEVAIIIGLYYFPRSWIEALDSLAVVVFAVTFTACLSGLWWFTRSSRIKYRGLLFCLALRGLLPPFQFSSSGPDILAIIADAVVLGTISVEFFVSSIAQRPIHGAVIGISVASLFHSSASLILCALYQIGLLADISYSTGIPLFVPIRNVYIDGVFDLCHYGHKRLMEAALQHGNRLIVGVLSDEDCVNYKRRPIMTLDERCREVSSCKFVSEVIRGAPSDGLTEEFINMHNIHVVCYGEEYNNPNDHYYAVPRKLGIGVTHPRTQGLSTSALIKRIITSSPDELTARDKASGKSTVKED